VHGGVIFFQQQSSSLSVSLDFGPGDHSYLVPYDSSLAPAMLLPHFFRFNDGATALPPPRPASRSPRDAAILLSFGARYDEGRRESAPPSPPSVPLLLVVVVVLVGGDVVVKK